MFEKGHIDPRLIIHLFKDFQKFVDDESIYVYRGVKDLVERLGTIEDIGKLMLFYCDLYTIIDTRSHCYSILVSHSLSKNYDPHIKPSASTAPETQELRRTLIFNAKATLQKFLAKDRANGTWGHRLLNSVDEKILKVFNAYIITSKKFADLEESGNFVNLSANICRLSTMHL